MAPVPELSVVAFVDIERAPDTFAAAVSVDVALVAEDCAKLACVVDAAVAEVEVEVAAFWRTD